MENLKSDNNKPVAKKSSSESGNAVNLGSFALLIKTVATFKEKYNPFNPDLEINALEALYQKAKADMDACVKAETHFDNTTANRSTLFKQMKRLGTKAHRSLKSSKAPKTAKEHAQTIINKLRGYASRPKKKDIMKESEEAQKSISNSQQSYTQLVEHFKKLRELLSSHEAYKPNEAELTADALTYFQKQLTEENEKVNNAIADWRKIRRLRSHTFYAPESGLVDTAFNVKDYIASVFDTISPEFKEVNKIRFRNIKHK